MASFRSLKRWKHEGAKSGLRGGCVNTICPSCLVAYWVLMLALGLALSCWSNISCRFLSDQTWWKCFHIFSVCWYMRLSFVPVSITSRRITPFTVPECHNHHLYSQWRELEIPPQGRISMVPLRGLPFRLFTLFAEWPTVLLLTAAFP